MKKQFIHRLLAIPSLTDQGISLTLKEAFEQTEKEFKRLNSLVRKRDIEDDVIAHSIFSIIRGEPSEHELKVHAYDQFTAAYKSFTDIRLELEKNGKFNDEGIKQYSFLVTTIIYDIRPYANFIGQQKDRDYILFHGGKASLEDSRWHYHGTGQLVYNSIYDKKMLDDKFAMILAPVALRQTIELKMQRILGVADFIDKKGQKIFTDHHFFFDFIRKHKSHFELGDLNLNILQKVFEFCNISVHKGVMPYYWQMFYALKYCAPLYRYKNVSGKLDPPIKVKQYEELKAKLEEKLIKKFAKPEYELEIIWLKPEAEIIS